MILISADTAGKKIESGEAKFTDFEIYFIDGKMKFLQKPKTKSNFERPKAKRIYPPEKPRQLSRIDPMIKEPEDEYGEMFIRELQHRGVNLNKQLKM